MVAKVLIQLWMREAIVSRVKTLFHAMVVRKQTYYSGLGGMGAKRVCEKVGSVLEEDDDEVKRLVGVQRQVQKTRK